MQLGVNESFADYLIEGVLGRGGMGTVYSAQHPRLPRRVALKLLNREVSADPELRRRFEQEANVVARLDHPGIVGIHDRGTQDGHLWIAMQYIHGTDASRLNPRDVPVDRALRIVTETGAALDHAHSRGVLHRDIKPANILLSSPDTGRAERAVLTDFGIARLLDSNTQLTASGTFNATLAYASPEQLSGERVDHRSDQYSLACTLFTLLAGHPPFAATNPGQVVAGHISKPVPRLSSVRSDAPPALDEVIARAMAKRPDERFGSCREFTTAAWESLHGRPPSRMAAAPARIAPTALNQHTQGRQAPIARPAQTPHLAPAPSNSSAPSPKPATPNDSATPNGSAPSHNAATPNGSAPSHNAAPPNGSAPSHNAAPPSGPAPSHNAAPSSGSAPSHNLAPSNGAAASNAPAAANDPAPASGFRDALAACVLAVLLGCLVALEVVSPREPVIRAFLADGEPRLAPYAASGVAGGGAVVLLLCGAVLLLARKRLGRALVLLGCAGYLASLAPVRMGYDSPAGTTGWVMAAGVGLLLLTLVFAMSKPTARWLRAGSRR
ncbi:protein kinase [Nocardia sp. NPDC006044]|uniref:protein kinase domain-containing protein n=1 Tax=Nocardia sp. NPDC006044 TaxID=3364306 RepID=UPI00367F4FF5